MRLPAVISLQDKCLVARSRKQWLIMFLPKVWFVDYQNIHHPEHVRSADFQAPPQTYQSEFTFHQILRMIYTHMGLVHYSIISKLNFEQQKNLKSSVQMSALYKPKSRELVPVA